MSFSSGTERQSLIRNSGTAVVWEHLDRLVSGTTAESAHDRDVFNDRIEEVEKQLSMVFQRFLERSGVERPLTEVLRDPDEAKILAPSGRRFS